MRSLVLIAAMWSAGCALDDVFACDADPVCGDEGQCELSTGYCSFPDPQCPTGQRYGSHAGDGLAGECVEPSGGGTSLSGGTGSADGGSGDGGPGDGGPGPGSADSTGSDGGPVGACAPADSCVAAAPAGWSGPGLWVDGALTGAACPADTTSSLGVLREGLSVDPSSCGCTCSPVSGSCGTVTLRYNAPSNACSSGSTTQLDENTCTTLSLLAPPDGGYASLTGPLPTGACGGSLNETHPSPTWASAVFVCDEGLTSCDGGVCLPSPGMGTSLCIAQEGEHECPAGQYSEAHVMYTAVTDDRSCTACQCASPVGMCRVVIRSGTQCNMQPDADWAADDPSCHSVIGLGSQAAFELQTSDACGVGSSSATGVVTPTGVTTVCCTPSV